MRILHVCLTKTSAYELLMDMDAYSVRIPEITFLDHNNDVNAIVYPSITPVTWATSYDEILYYDEKLNITDMTYKDE